MKTIETEAAFYPKRPHPKVLIVDDDPGLRKLLQKTLTREGFQVETASHGNEVLDHIKSDPHLVLLLDQQLPDAPGKEIITSLQAQGYYPPFIIITGEGNEQLAVQMMKLGAFDYIVKSPELPTLLPEVLKRLFEKHATEKKLHRTEAALKEKTALLENITDNMLDLIALTDIKGNFSYVGKSHKIILGYELETLLGKNVMDYVHPEDLPGIMEAFQSAIAGNLDSRKIAYRYQCADGSYIWLETVGKIIRNDDGLISHWLFSSRDITERKLAVEKLKTEQHEKQLILENLAEQVSFLDPGMRIIWANNKVRGRHRLHPEQYKGYKCFEVFHQLGEPCPDCPIPAVLETGKTQSGVHRSPDNRYWQVTGTPVYGECGEMIGVLNTSLDITELKKIESRLLKFNLALEEKVQQRTAALEAINRELDAFTYSVSHDLRAPLRRIEGFSQALSEEYSEKIDDTGRNYLNRIMVSTAAMNELIEDLLKLSKINKQDLAREPIELSVIVKIHLNQLQDKEPERHVETVISPGQEITGDTALMRIALGNLLENAWKYTAGAEPAKIEFGSFAKEGKTVYYIKDNGAGFDMKSADKLFDPFQRLHSKDKYQGTGIGLSIVSRIIKRHGGTIWAEGEVNRGATFYFQLPE